MPRYAIDKRKSKSNFISISQTLLNHFSIYNEEESIVEEHFKYTIKMKVTKIKTT